MLSYYLSNCRRCLNAKSKISRWRSCIRHTSTSNWSKLTHYQVLGVPVNASSGDIRAAFVTMSKQVHPDRNPGDPDNHSKFIRLNEAYSILIRKQSREEYDISIGLIANSNPYHPSYNTASRSSRYYESEGVGYEGSEFNAATGHKYYAGGAAPRVPNYVIAVACGGIVVLGFIYFLIGYQYTILRQRKRLDALDRRNVQYLKESRENARRNGFQRQLEIMLERDAERRRGIEAAAAEIVESSSSSSAGVTVPRDSEDSNK